MNFLYIVPARVGSKRLPEKNFRPFSTWKFGLVERLLAQLDMVQRAHKTVLSSDIIQPLEVCKKYRAEFHLRPDALAADNTTTEDVVRFVAEAFGGLKWDYLCVTQVTSPYTMKYDFEMLQDLAQEYKCPGFVAVNRSTMKPCGAFYAVERVNWEENHTLYPKGLMPVLVDNLTAMDIDEWSDFRIAEGVHEGRLMD